MKLSLKNLAKMIEVCTKKEIDVMLYFGRLQDDGGVVVGVRYDEVMAETDICRSTFFAIIKSLEVKGMIEVSNINEPSYWTITIVDNVFKTQEDYKKGYLNLNRQIFTTKAFRDMTKGEKVTVLNLVKLSDLSQSIIKITFKKIVEWTGKSMRSVKKFVETLSNVLRIIKKDNVCLVDCRQMFGACSVSEKDVHNKHIINYRLRKAKCEADKGDINDVCTLMKQFASYGQEKIIGAIDKALHMLGSLGPAFINKEIRSN